VINYLSCSPPLGGNHDLSRDTKLPYYITFITFNDCTVYYTAELGSLSLYEICFNWLATYGTVKRHRSVAGNKSRKGAKNEKLKTVSILSGTDTFLLSGATANSYKPV
jgi:hypothetical protein